MNLGMFGCASTLRFWGFCFSSLVLRLLIPCLVLGRGHSVGVCWLP